MAVATVDVRDGDPTVQASGQYRGTVDVTLDDGRVLTLNIRAANLDEWNDKVAAAGATIQEQVELRDADEAVTPDEDIAAHKQASIAQTCIAYIRQAWEQEQAYDAWNLYARINTYVTNHSDWNTAQTHLIAEGLTQEEYDQAKAAYQYLSGGGRPATMAEAITIQNNWQAQH